MTLYYSVYGVIKPYLNYCCFLQIAVVLLGIGVLDKNRESFTSIALDLPGDLHEDTMSIIQTVVQAGRTECSLTPAIQQVLSTPSG